jgi:RNA polymerase sigma factor (sigma-70 family)
LAEARDEELVRSARLGSKEAFNVLMERYQEMALRIARRMVNAEELAWDLSQEAMLQAFLCLADLRKAESFRSWFYGIVLNVTKSYLREQKRLARLGAYPERNSLQADEAFPSPSPDPQQIAMERELNALVLAALEELPAAHREPAKMFYQESLTLHEITALTGATPGTIKVRLFRARSQLREKIRSAYPDLGTDSQPKEKRNPMIKANIVDILKHNEVYVVFLQEESGEKLLPIWVGSAEGTAIALGLRAYPAVRPLTFEFMAHLLDALGAHVEEVRVETLKKNVFYGVVKVRIGKKVKDVDARPSDALALAVRTASPIFVAEEILLQEGIDRATYEQKYGAFAPGEGAKAIQAEFVKELERHLNPPPPQPEGQT